MPGISIRSNRHSGTSWSSYWTTHFVSDLLLTVASGEQVNLSITLNGGHIYKLSWEYSTDGVTFTEHGTTNEGVNTYSPNNLTPYTVYFWRVRPFKGSNYSSVYSNIKYGRTSFPSIISDGNTKGMYKDTALSTITKDSVNRVALWADLLGSGNDLPQTTDDNKGVWDFNGITFDGSNDFMKKAFPFTQPEFIYMLLKPITWTIADKIFDGNSATERGLVTQDTSSPDISASAGTASSRSSNLTLGSDHILRVLFNGANSKLIVDGNSPITGNFGSQNMNGFTLASVYTGANNFANVAYREIILRQKADNSTDEGKIYNYLLARKTDPYGHIRLANMPQSINQHGFEACNGKLYAIGGNTQEPSSTNLNTCYEYDPNTNAWTQKANIPIATQSPVLRSVGNKLYLIGGILTGSTAVTGRVFEFNPSTNEWTEKTAMPTPREDMGSAVYDGKIYVFGGLKHVGVTPTPINTLEIYDPATDTWDETKADMPGNKWSGDFGVVCNGKIYAISSAETFDTYPIVAVSTAIYEYNPGNDTWSTKTAIPEGVAYKECVAVGTDIFVGPGQINGDYHLNNTKTRSIYKYDTLTDKWTKISIAPYSAFGISMAVLNSKIYLSGGAFNGDHNELYEIVIPS